jgi:hypothetical protein
MIYLTAIGLTSGGSSTVHIYTQTTHRTEHIHKSKKIRTYLTIKSLKLILKVRAMPRLCELYPGICLTTEKKHGKTSVMVAARTSQADTVQYKKNK